MKRYAWPVVVSSIVGVAACGWAVHSVGVADLLGALKRIGVGGFIVYVLSTLPGLVALGFAWASGLRGGVERPLAFAWARAVREAASDLLPFSQLGGLVLGTRALIADGIAPTRVYAATVIDLTTEMLAQLMLTLFGLYVFGALLSGADDPSRLHHVARTGVAGMGVLMLLFITLQKPALRLAAKLGGRVLPAAGAAIEAVRTELEAFGEKRLAMLPSFLWNMVAWLLTIFSSWLALRLLGVAVTFEKMVALETLIFAIRSGGFLIPGAIGVQEAGYVLLAPAFGLDGGAVLALSLIKRARDIGLGVIVLALLPLRMKKRPL